MSDTTSLMQTPREGYRLFKKETLYTSEEHSKRDERYLNQIEYQLKKPLLSALTASEIDTAIATAASLRKIANNGGHQDNGENMRFRLGQAVVCYFRWAHGQGILQRNLYMKNNHRRPPRRIANFQSEVKLQEIEKREVDYSPKIQAILAVLRDCGLRASELVKIRVSDINFNDYYIQTYMNKVERWKTPVFTEKTKETLLTWLSTPEWARRGSKYLFPGKGLKDCPVSTQQIRRLLKKVGNDVGWRNNPHSYRHGTATRWMANGAPQSAIMDQMGLEDTKILNVYVHMANQQKREIQKEVYSKAKQGGKLF